MYHRLDIDGVDEIFVVLQNGPETNSKKMGVFVEWPDHSIRSSNNDLPHKFMPLMKQAGPIDQDQEMSDAM
ncbi:hypothetical protein PanWU01x14_317500, partial [Parasponia andersonii]